MRASNRSVDDLDNQINHLVAQSKEEEGDEMTQFNALKDNLEGNWPFQDYDERFGPLIRKCLKIDPEKRASAGELIDFINDFDQ